MLYQVVEKKVPASATSDFNSSSFIQYFSQIDVSIYLFNDFCHEKTIKEWVMTIIVLACYVSATRDARDCFVAKLQEKKKPILLSNVKLDCDLQVLAQLLNAGDLEPLQMNKKKTVEIAFYRFLFHFF